MAKLKYEEWRKLLQGTEFDAKLKGLTPNEVQTVYRTVVARQEEAASSGTSFLAENATNTQMLGTFTRQALDELKSFEKNPGPTNVPKGVQAASPQAQQDAITSQAQANKVKGDKGASPEQKQSAQQRALALVTGGASSWFPWMTDALRGGITSAPTSGGTPSLSDAQVTAWRDRWNQENPDRIFKDNQTFLNASGAQQGRPEFRAAFQRALNVGSNEYREYDVARGVPTGSPRDQYTKPGERTVRVNASWVDLANDAQKGGSPDLDRYMKSIMRAADDAHVPWQLLWGVLRARKNFDPRTTTQNGPFNLDPNIVPAGTSASAAIDFVAAQLRGGFEETGDWGLAALRTDGEDGRASAENLRHTGHSTSGREAKDGEYLQAVFGGKDKSGAGNLSLYDIGYGTKGENKNTHLDPVFSQLGGSGSDGPTVNVPDMAVLRQQADDMIRKVLFREPSSAEVDAMAGSMREAVVQSQMQAIQGQGGGGAGQNPYAIIYDNVSPSAGAAGGVNMQDQVDPQARMYEAVKNSSDYQYLYANRGGLSEQDYAQQFQGASQELLGDPNANNAALREGLHTGDVETFRGIIAGSGMQNRNFRRGLYQAAELIARL